MKMRVKFIKFASFCLCMLASVLIFATVIHLSHFRKRLFENIRGEQLVTQDVNGGSHEQSLRVVLKELENTKPQTTEKSYNTNVMPFMFLRNASPSFFLGTGRRDPVRVVIGIPHVKRPSGDSYLNKTLDSLTQRIFPDDEDGTAIVVFIAEKDDTNYVRQQARYLYARYKREIDSGLVQVIGPPDNFYPNFKELKPNLGDPPNQVWWRSKEIVDAALLMLYCHNMAEYYLMLEDDVIAAKGYMRAIFDFTETRNDDKFVMVKAAGYLGSIGRLYKNADLPTWVSAFLTFHNLKPIDWLMEDITRLIACSGMDKQQCADEMRRELPELPNPLFFHVGYKSSLAGRTYEKQTSREDTFGKLGIRNSHRNPSIKIKTSMKEEYFVSDLKRWYKDSGGMKNDFCLRKADTTDFISFHFETPQAIEHILIKTGIFDSDFDSRTCEGCASLEISTTKPPDEPTFKVCGISDAGGNLECRLSPPTLSSAFRISMKNIERQICFNLAYVKVA